MVWNVKNKKAAKFGDWAVTGIDGNLWSMQFWFGLTSIKWMRKHK